MLTRIMKNRSGALSRRLAKTFTRLLMAYENVDYDHRSNGEAMVLAALARSGAKTLFDVGANIGNYTRLALDSVPAAQVYAFEVVPETFARLQTEIGSRERVTLVNAGLSNRAGKVRLKTPEALSTRASLFDYPGHKQFSWVEGEVLAGDEFCASRGIEAIDFLKIDTEGAEHLVLEGFARMLAERRIEAIQFEYGYVNILSRFLLADYYALFAKHGYRLGKLYARGVGFKDYALADENFWGPNYLAVREDRQDLIARLACAA